MSKDWWKNGQMKTKMLGEKPDLCHFGHHEYHMD
jgi:hypothetical protein